MKNKTIISEDKVYLQIRQTILSAKEQVNRSVNVAMVQAYWQIGKTIFYTMPDPMMRNI